MRPCDCFEAGRFTSIQSSWTATGCSRKWMSGHALALPHTLTDRKPQLSVKVVRPTIALQEKPFVEG
jgi:hypothetical protein